MIRMWIVATVFEPSVRGCPIEQMRYRLNKRGTSLPSTDFVCLENTQQCYLFTCIKKMSFSIVNTKFEITVRLLPNVFNFPVVLDHF